jgi:PAS domain S-box-containing protein
MPPLFRTLRWRLLLSSAIPVLLFFGAAIVAFVAIQRLLYTLDLVQHSQQIVARAYDLKADLTGMEAAKRAAYLLRAGTPTGKEGKPRPDISREESFRQEYQRHWRSAQKSLSELRELAGKLPGRNERLDNLAARMQSLHDLSELALRLPGPSKGEGDWWTQIMEGLKQAVLLGGQADEEIAALITAEKERLRERHALAQRATRESVWAIAVAVGGSFFLAMLIPLQLTRSIIGPIERLQEAARGLRRGEFTTLAPEGPAEIASLMSHFNMMGLAFSEREGLLQTSERRYRGLMGSLSHVLWTTNPAGEMTTDPAVWLTFTGQDAECVQREGWLSAVHAEDRERASHRWRDCLASRQPYEDEFRVRRHDGEWRTMACRGVPIFNPRGEVIEWVCTCADITEQKQEDELRRAKEAAEATSRAKSSFLAKMSHELRTPLNAIIGMSKMLSTQRFGPLNAKQADYLNDVTRAGEHLLMLINDVLDLSKVEAGHMEILPERTPVTATVSALLSTLRALVETKGVNVEFEPPSPDDILVTDPGRFKQVLFNLASNAIKFTPDGGTVRVRCLWVDHVRREASEVPREQAGGLRIDVEDTGIGIAPENQQRIWEEFRQVNNPGRTDDGTGLGLALTRRLVALLGGVVWLDHSEPDRGSRFSVVLPPMVPDGAGAEPPPPPPARTKTPAERTTASMGRAVALVIEDHMPTNKLLSDWLADAGLETSSAFDGRSGLEQARRLRPRLILLDLRLPRMDGWQVLTELKSDPRTREIPVLIISIQDDRQAPGNIDVADWFVKPLDRDQFLGRLRAGWPELFNGNRRQTALVVDDHAPSRAWLRELLRDERIEVFEASSGTEALSRLEEITPDLVVVDLLMPGMDGFAVVEAIRARPALAEVPILVVSAKDITREEWERLQGNIQAVLRKDLLTPERLSERLQRLGLARGDLR